MYTSYVFFITGICKNTTFIVIKCVKDNKKKFWTKKNHFSNYSYRTVCIYD